MKHIYLSIDYCLKQIKYDRYFFSLVVFSFSAIMLIPLCILGVGLSSYHYSLSFVPQPAHQSIVLYLDDGTNILLDSDTIKETFPEIAYFSLSQNQPIIISTNHQFTNATLTGAHQDIDSIFRFQKIKGTPLLNFTQLDDSQHYCWIGSDLYNKLHNKQAITIDQQTYQIAGVIHTQEVKDIIFINPTDFAQHSDLAYTYNLKFKDATISPEEIDDFIQQFQTTLAIKQPIYWSDWTGYDNYHKSVLKSVLGFIIIVAIVVLTYGCLNIMTVMINKTENQEKEIRTQWFLGVEIKQLYLQEFIYTMCALLCAIALDWLIVLFLRYFFIDYLNVYIVLNFSVFLLTIIFATVMSLIIAFILLIKRIRLLSL